MDLQPDSSFHIYNQGNNQQPIFFEIENYLFFLRKMRIHLLPYSNILAYCLMPNHFHWFLYVKDKVDDDKKDLNKTPDELLTDNIGTLLSSYAQAINNKYDRTGSLFRHKTKSVKVDNQNHGLICLHYIHQNPVKANLATKMGEWPFSSFSDYAGARNGTLVGKEFTFNYLDINPNSFVEESMRAIDLEKLKHLY